MLRKTVVLVLAVAVCFSGAEPIRQKTARRRVSARQQLAAPAPTGYPPAGVTPAVPFDLPTETQEPDTVYGPPAAEPDVVYGPPAAEPDVVYGPPATEAQEPDTVYGPPAAEPDVVYGPPQQPDTVYGPPQTEEEPQPDTVYGPPETVAQEPDTVYGPPQTDSNPEDEFTQVQPSEEELEEEAEDVDEIDEEVLINDDGSVIAISTAFDQGNLEGKPARLVYQRFPQSRRQAPTSVPARLRLAKIRRPSNIVYTSRYQRL